MICIPVTTTGNTNMLLREIVRDEQITNTKKQNEIQIKQAERLI